MRALGQGAFLQHRRASGPRRRPTSGPRPRVPHVVDPGCVGVEASTPHQPWVPSRDSSGTPVGTLSGVSLPPYACSAPPPLRARVKGRVGVSPRERDAVRVSVGCGWCSTRRLSLCAVAGWPQHSRAPSSVSLALRTLLDRRTTLRNLHERVQWYILEHDARSAAPAPQCYDDRGYSPESTLSRG